MKINLIKIAFDSILCIGITQNIHDPHTKHNLDLLWTSGKNINNTVLLQQNYLSSDQLFLMY